jgi:hypothetical protein
MGLSGARAQIQQFFPAAGSPDHAAEIASRIAELGIIAKK